MGRYSLQFGDHGTNQSVVAGFRNWRRAQDNSILLFHFYMTMLALSHTLQRRTRFSLTTSTDYDYVAVFEVVTEGYRHERAFRNSNKTVPDSHFKRTHHAP